MSQTTGRNAYGCCALAFYLQLDEGTAQKDFLGEVLFNKIQDVVVVRLRVDLGHHVLDHTVLPNDERHPAHSRRTDPKTGFFTPGAILVRHFVTIVREEVEIQGIGVLKFLDQRYRIRTHA